MSLPPANLNHSSDRNASHILALDGLRGIAILLVLFYHLAPRSSPGASLFGLGYCGVDLFFVLSGFLITGILLKTKHREGYLRNFFFRRTLRIFPLYYGILVVAFIVLPVLHLSPFESSDTHQAWFWLYGSNIPAGIKSFPFRSLNHFWSLAVEEQFYLVWPFVVMLAGEKLLARLCVAAIIGALALRLLIVNFTDMPMAAYTFAPCRMDDLAVGALVALSFNKTGPMPARSIFATAPLWWALAAALMGLMATSSDYAFTNPVFLTLGLSLFAMFFASTLAIAATSTGIVSRFLECRIFGILGKFSYGLYVFHPLVHGMVSRSLRKRSLELSPWIEFTITFSFSFGIAWLSYQAYEKQFLKLKRHFVSSRRSTHVVTALPIDVEHPIAADGPTSIRNILVSPIPETSRH